MNLPKDFEPLFVFSVAEIIENNRRWREARWDLNNRFLPRRAEVSSTPGEQKLETVYHIYGAPSRRQGCRPTVADRLRFRESMKHLRAKYPEFLPPAERRIPTHVGHEREP